MAQNRDPKAPPLDPTCHPPRSRAAWCLLAAGVLLAASCQRVEPPSPEAQAPPQIITTRGGVEMVAIPAGWFRMGSERGKDDERPLHRVSIDGFLMDRCEVTQEQFEQFKLELGNPSHFRAPKNPVEQVSWAEAARYCNMRSAAEGLTPCYDPRTARCNFSADGYRLPTEAEWEYACRAGSAEAYSFGGDPRQLAEHAWYAENSAAKTHPVGQKRPNAWGLLDMHGNVAEWCNDVYDPEYYRKSPERDPTGPDDGEKYVLRGGAWNSKPEGCRSAYRVGEDPGFQDACFARDAAGFRCVRRGARKEGREERGEGRGKTAFRSNPGSATSPLSCLPSPLSSLPSPLSPRPSPLSSLP